MYVCGGGGRCCRAGGGGRPGEKPSAPPALVSVQPVSLCPAWRTRCARSGARRPPAKSQRGGAGGAARCNPAPGAAVHLCGDLLQAPGGCGRVYAASPRGAACAHGGRPSPAAASSAAPSFPAPRVTAALRPQDRGACPAAGPGSSLASEPLCQGHERDLRGGLSPFPFISQILTPPPPAPLLRLPSTSSPRDIGSHGEILQALHSPFQKEGHLSPKACK